VSTGSEASAYALLTDGTTIEIRPTRPGDFDAVREMHAKMSSDNLYLRFFGVSALAAEQEARRICREPALDHGALLAVLDGEVVGCGSFEVTDDGSRSAEVAMAVADEMHSRGVGTLLLEHLISLARRRGVRGNAAGVCRRWAAGAARPGGRRVRPNVSAACRRGRRRPRHLP
jgi:GNAT superfamily N-acetyltransferase